MLRKYVKSKVWQRKGIEYILTKEIGKESKFLTFAFQNSC